MRTRGPALLRSSGWASLPGWLRASYGSRLKSEAEIVDSLIDLAIKSRMTGILSLEKDEHETSVLFLRRALGCLVDNYDPAQIRDILNTEMFFKLRREDSERVLRTIADFCPAFGIVGSVAGLIPAAVSARPASSSRPCRSPSPRSSTA